ncbi:hypothetical protein BKM25_28940 [Pseudomonas avellanae]|nr:hypothetical protein BKM25_28940 [Pseudomonas avellanae]
MGVPLSDVPHQTIGLLPVPVRQTLVTMNHPLEDIAQTAMLTSRLAGLQHFEMFSAHMPQQNASGLRTFIALDMALENL